MTLEARGLTKRFGTHLALDGVDMVVREGSLTALLGPSGCGKTTLLRLFAGLDAPDQGTILLGGRDQGSLNPMDRQVGFVFQHYALFRHMDIFENVAFGLRAKPRKERPREVEIRDRVHQILSLVQLEGQSRKMPHELSGGQRQRVALARSLVVEPRMLLLDEPFGALDAGVRRELRRWLRDLQSRLGITTILVTHDQEEALEVADQVVLMRSGRIEQSGSPEDLYLRPANPFVYRFLGAVNLFHRRLESGHFVPMDPDAETGSGPDAAWARPHEVAVSREPFRGALEAVVERVRFAGPMVHLDLVLEQDGASRLEAGLALADFVAAAWKVGDRVWAAPRTVTVFQDPGQGI